MPGPPIPSVAAVENWFSRGSEPVGVTDCQKITLERHIQGAGFPGSSTKDNTMSSFRLQMCPFPNLGGRLENHPRVLSRVDHNPYTLATHLSQP